MPTKGSPRLAVRTPPALRAALEDAIARDPLRRNISEVARDLLSWWAGLSNTRPTRPDADRAPTP